MIISVELTHLRGRELRAARRDAFGVRLDFAGGQAVAVEAEFGLVMASGVASGVDSGGADGQERIDPAGTEPARLQRALAPLLGLRARRCEALDGGELVLEFEDGSRLLAPAGDRYESWSYTGPGGLQVISLPEGGVALFPGR